MFTIFFAVANKRDKEGQMRIYPRELISQKFPLHTRSMCIHSGETLFTIQVNFGNIRGDTDKQLKSKIIFQ